MTFLKKREIQQVILVYQEKNNYSNKQGQKPCFVANYRQSHRQNDREKFEQATKNNLSQKIRYSRQNMIKSLYFAIFYRYNLALF